MIYFISLFFGIFFGCFAALITCSIFSKKSKTTKPASDIFDYLKNADIKYSHSEDKYLYTEQVARLNNSDGLNGNK